MDSGVAALDEDHGTSDARVEDPLVEIDSMAVA